MSKPKIRFIFVPNGGNPHGALERADVIVEEVTASGGVKRSKRMTQDKAKAFLKHKNRDVFCVQGD